MKGAKLYKVEIWHYADESHNTPWEEWNNPPETVTEIPNCETAEIDYLWEDNNQLFGPRPDNLTLYGSIKTYDHRAARYLVRRYPFQEYQVIGDCLLLYYTTDDGQQWRYRFNGVFFGSGRVTRAYTAEEVDTGKSEHSLLTWTLARFHHGNEELYLSNWNNRVKLEMWDGDNWVAPPPM